MIPDSDKQQKLSFSIGVSKPNCPSASSSSYCQPSSASSSSSSSSLSSSQSTSDVQPDVCFIPRALNQVSGMPFCNGDQNPVGNGESDQENCGTLDNGSSSKSHPNENKDTGNVFDNSPKTANGESGVHHHGNGLNGQTYGDFKSSQNGHHNGHHKVNGHSGPDKISGSNHGSLTSTAPVANGIGSDHSQPNKDASSQASSSQSIHPAANESQDFSTPVTRAKTPSEPLPHCTESSAVSASPSATATTTPSVAAKESASALSSSGQDGNPAALPPQPDCSQSTSGASAAPQKVSVSKDEAKDLPQDKCATTGTEGRKDTKEQYQSKPSSSCNEK
ncbi:putative protein TPRXL [Simochromis diagramma]|uniref:putative protein TPRXL n=1 Tax=Simochromis diagramma TaxID=43689 RepID=UPI001A7E971B|nr:putative protein TPRXL [Simochromis diagramma]